MKAIEIIELFVSDDDTYDVVYREGYTNATVYKNSLKLEYYCTLIIKDDMVYFNNVLYNDFNNLILAVDKYNKTLLYPHYLISKNSNYYSIYNILGYILRIKDDIAYSRYFQNYNVIIGESDKHFHYILLENVHDFGIEYNFILRFDISSGNDDIDLIYNKDGNIINIINHKYLNYVENLNQKILFIIYHLQNIIKFE